LVRGITIGKTGKTAVLPKFSIALTLSQVGGVDYTHPGIGFVSPKKSRRYDPVGSRKRLLLFAKLHAHTAKNKSRLSEAEEALRSHETPNFFY
jgi:hypothetical protein